MTKDNFTRKSVIDSFMGNDIPGKKSAEAESPKPKKTASSKLTIDVKEHRSFKKQLLMTPTLYKRLEREAKKNGTSVNNLINLILEAYLDQ